MQLQSQQPNTMGSMKAMVTRYHKEDEDTDLLADCINDAIESIWRSILLVAIGNAMKGPVQNLEIESGSLQKTIVTIPDPTDAPTTGETDGGNLPSPRSVFLKYTYVTASGSETLASPAAEQAIADPEKIATCDPPPFVKDTIGWNVYAADADNGRFARQNDAPLSFSTTWQEPEDTGIEDDPDLPPEPLENTTADNIFYLRLMQVQNPDGTWTTWQAGNIDDLLMLRASCAIAAATTYQGYAYDFFNGRTIQLRPAAGMQLDPQYFYVEKPRRIIYDNATLPFTNISTTEFVKIYAEASLDLSNKEFASYNIKSSKAERIRLEIVQGLNTQQTTKQRTITPYFSW